jgi:hypothetical protein
MLMVVINWSEDYLINVIEITKEIILYNNSLNYLSPYNYIVYTHRISLVGSRSNISNSNVLDHLLEDP